MSGDEVPSDGRAAAERRTRRSKRWRIAVFAVVQLLSTVLLLELALRLLRPHHPFLGALLYLPSERKDFSRVETLEELLAPTVLGFAPYQRRRAFILNSRSFRTGEYTGEKQPGTLRIMCLGDSFTFASGGVPYRRMWPVELEARLEPLLPFEVDVFSLGVPGAGPRFELRLFELEQPLVRADLVVLAFFVGNDFTDERDKDPLPHVYRLARNGYRLWRQRRSDVWLENASDPAPAAGPEGRRGGYEVPPGPREIGPAMADPVLYLGIESARIRIVMKSRREEFLGHARALEEVLRRFDAAVEAAGAELVVMIIPDEFQLNDELRRRVLEHLALSEDDLDLDLPQRRLREILSAAGIAHLDLLPAFRERSRHETLYWPNDSHWNVAGNRFAARLLADYLARGPLAEAQSPHRP